MSPRPPTPDAVERLRRALQDLHEDRLKPTVRELETVIKIQQARRPVGRTKISQILNCDPCPSKEELLVIVKALNGDEEWFAQLWNDMHDIRIDRSPPEQPVEPGECSGSVAVPEVGFTVGKEIQVEGVVQNLPERHHIWIAHQDRRGLFWAKDFEVIPDHEGRFKRLVYEGGELRSFTLLLLLASEAGHRQLNGWMAECSRVQSWPGIPPAPDRFHVLDSVTLQFDPAPTGQSGGPPI
jgi:hypothetical protein